MTDEFKSKLYSTLNKVRTEQLLYTLIWFCVDVGLLTDEEAQTVGKDFGIDYQNYRR